MPSPLRSNRPLLLACAASSLALAAACLLPRSAGAVPIQTPNGAQVAAPTESTGSSGPRRPGTIPTPSLSLNNGTSPDRTAGPRRPVPAQPEAALTAEK